MVGHAGISGLQLLCVGHGECRLEGMPPGKNSSRRSVSDAIEQCRRKVRAGRWGKKARKSQCLETGRSSGDWTAKTGNGGVAGRAPHCRHDLIRTSDWLFPWRDPALHMRHPRVGLSWRQGVARDPAYSSCPAPPRLAPAFCTPVWAGFDVARGVGGVEHFPRRSPRISSVYPAPKRLLPGDGHPANPKPDASRCS